jgi:hypothetical protein
MVQYSVYLRYGSLADIPQCTTILTLKSDINRRTANARAFYERRL